LGPGDGDHSEADAAHGYQPTKLAGLNSTQGHAFILAPPSALSENSDPSADGSIPEITLQSAGRSADQGAGRAWCWGSDVIYLIIVVFEIAAVWKVFVKAGKPGWGAIIPIYNSYLLCKIANRPGWWVILMFIPIVNIVIAIIVLHDLSKGFGHGAGFTVGLILLSFIFFPILGFGASQYRGAPMAARAY
jgi:hypothetical protein